MSTFEQDLNHFQTMTTDLTGCVELITQLETNSPELKTFADAAKYKLLTHAETIRGLAVALRDKGPGPRLN